jgi:hypothetical protein
MTNFSRKQQDQLNRLSRTQKQVLPFSHPESLGVAMKKSTAYEGKELPESVVSAWVDLDDWIDGIIDPLDETDE